jgi:hypothetical protein
MCHSKLAVVVSMQPQLTALEQMQRNQRGRNCNKNLVSENSSDETWICVSLLHYERCDMLLLGVASMLSWYITSVTIHYSELFFFALFFFGLQCPLTAINSLLCTTSFSFTCSFEELFYHLSYFTVV